MEDKDILKTLADNPLLFEAVKKALLSKFDLPEAYGDVRGVSKFNNEEVGQWMRSRIEALMAINDTFQEIAALRSTKPLPEESNPGR